MNALSLSKVEVNFGDTAVLRGITLDVPPGTLLAIVGPSGCGKTTLLRTIAGLQRARSGDIRLGQRLLTTHGMHLVPEKRRIGWVPQDAALFPHLTVAENVAFGLGAGRASASVSGSGSGTGFGSARSASAGGRAVGGRRIGPAEPDSLDSHTSRASRALARGARVTELLELVGLSHLADRNPAQLSGGQAQRVALARALAVSPQLVLLDEPFAALDPVLRAELRTEVRELLRAQGVTGILVTHDQSEALSVADNVAVMRDGEILQFGAPVSVYGRPSTPWVANFVGEAVFVPGVWAGGMVSSVLGTVDADWVPNLPLPADGAGVSLLVRPEQLILAPSENTGPGAEHGASSAHGAGAEHGASSAALAGRVLGPGVAATVSSVNYTGHDAILGLILDDGTVCESRVTAAGLLPTGARVTVRIAGTCLAYPA